jgi:hypothetical protein
VDPEVTQAILAGLKKYSELKVPVLAVFAAPIRPPPWLETADAKSRADGETYIVRLALLAEKQGKALEEGVAGARVVRFPNANHLVFASNEDEVMREMLAFMDKLDRP